MLVLINNNNNNLYIDIKGISVYINYTEIIVVPDNKTIEIKPINDKIT